MSILSRTPFAPLLSSFPGGPFHACEASTFCLFSSVTISFHTRCTKWEQGEIPEAHARLLGLRGDYHYNDPAEEPSRNIPQPKEVLRAAAATAGGVSSLRGGEIDGGLEVSGAKAGQGGGKFITYWSEKGTDRPVKWVFFTNAYFQASERSGRGRGGGEWSV